jgi:aminoglycoside 3-N-acetyltransferase
MIPAEPWRREKKIVDVTKEPITHSRLIADLRNIGLTSEDVVIVHSSMSKIGWIVGGPVTVIDSLMEVVGPEGTLLFPAQSTDNSEPSPWQYPAVPESWWQTIRDETPPFRPEVTPTRGIGRLPEVFRKYPHVNRSNHPQVSWAVWGRHAQYITETHPVDQAYGENSPLGKAYEFKAKILLLGATHESNTSLHYAEAKTNIPNFPWMKRSSAVLENGKRVWKTWDERNISSDDFNELGEAFEASIDYELQNIGQAPSRLLSMCSLVDFAVEWMEKNRSYDAP